MTAGVIGYMREMYSAAKTAYILDTYSAVPRMYSAVFNGAFQIARTYARRFGGPSSPAAAELREPAWAQGLRRAAHPYAHLDA